MIPELCCFHALYPLTMRGCMNLCQKIKFMHVLEQAKKTSGSDKDAKNPTACVTSADMKTIICNM
jgi:hypothetical protein